MTLSESDVRAIVADELARQRVGAEPLANPPVTIGELTDVPAPGSPIASYWGQEVTRRIVHRFPDAATRDAQYPAAAAGYGAVCAVWNVPYISDGSTWSQLAFAYEIAGLANAINDLTEKTRRMGCQVASPAGSTGPGNIGLMTFTTAYSDADGMWSAATPDHVTIPAAGIWAATFNLDLTAGFAGAGAVDLLLNGTDVSSMGADFNTGSPSATFSLTLAAGTRVGARLFINTASPVVSWSRGILDVWRIST